MNVRLLLTVFVLGLIALAGNVGRETAGMKLPWENIEDFAPSSEWESGHLHSFTTDVVVPKGYVLIVNGEYVNESKTDTEATGTITLPGNERYSLEVVDGCYAIRHDYVVVDRFVSDFICPE